MKESLTVIDINQLSLVGWLYLPLDAFLSDIPDDKVMVMANYRSTFTNVVAIRNTPQGDKIALYIVQ